MSQFISLQFESGLKTLSARRFYVREALSESFEVAVLARSHDHAIDLDSIAGHPASFTINTGFVHATAPIRTWSGVCSHFEQVQAEISATGESTYYVRIVPVFWLLTQRIGNRIFQRKTLPDIVQAVLKEWQITPTLKLTKKYVEHDYVVQYGETDHAFVCRLLERAGITFFFEFAPGAETKLVLSDEPQRGKSRGPVVWVDNPSRASEKEFATKVQVSQGVRPGKFTVREFDFRKKPDLAYFSKEAKAAAPEDFYEQYHYLPGDSLRVNPPDGGNGATPVADDKGKVRTSQAELDGRAERGLAAVRDRRRVVSFQSNCADLAPGTLFSIDHHPRSDLKPGEQFLVTAYEIEGAEGDVWTFTGRAAYAKNVWEPEWVTPRPRIPGVQSAMVVGPPGKEIYTDEIGRVRVQFPWDRDGAYTDDSSCWIRVSQPWAGAGFGMQLVPRVGHEVLVGFLEGDPDQPVVMGRAYNKINRVPHVLPDHKTRSTWKTDSSPHTGGYSEIMYEDKKGEELFYVQAELDMQKLTKREEVERTFANRTLVVGQNRSAVVKTVDATLVGDSLTVQMISPPSVSDLKILKQEQPSVSPLPTTVEMTKKRWVFTTGKASVVFDDDSITFEASGDIKIKADGGDAIFEGSHVYLNSRSPTAAAAPGAVQVVAAGTFVSTAGDRRKILNKHTEERAKLALGKLSPDDRKRFQATLAKAQSAQEADYLKKALAAGHSPAEIEAFADRIRGQTPTWMQDNLKLTGSSTGGGVQQQFMMACNVTTAQAVRGELDPVYALKVHDDNPNLGQVDARDPDRLNPNIAAEQRAMLTSHYNGSQGNFGGGEATPRDPAANPHAPAGRWADDKLNDLTPSTGVHYTTQRVGTDVTSAQAVQSIDAGLAKGAPVPIVIGATSADTTHYVLVTGSDDGPPKTYTIHDPWEGKTSVRTAQQVQNGQLGFGNLNNISAVESPSIVP